MNQCPAKPRKPAYKPRSGHGWYMGSQPAGQRLVDPAIHGVQPPDEHMGFVQSCQVKGCLAAGGWEQRSRLYRGQASGTPAAVEKRHPLPPPPAVYEGGPIPKFSPVFQRNGQ